MQTTRGAAQFLSKVTGQIEELELRFTDKEEVDKPMKRMNQQISDIIESLDSGAVGVGTALMPSCLLWRVQLNVVSALSGFE